MALGNSQHLKDDLESVNRTLHARILSSFVETYVWYGFVYVAEAMSNATQKIKWRPTCGAKELSASKTSSRER